MKADNFGISEADQILVPIDGGYKAYPLLTLLGFSRRMLRSTSGFGLAPLHFITQRGPEQHGSSPLDMRYDEKVIQIVIAEQLASRSNFWDRRNDLLDYLRPNRAFGTSVVTPLIYRKWYPGGHLEAGTDMSVTNGSPTVTSLTARFVHRGGLLGGEGITIGGVNYVIDNIVNDFTAVLTTNYAAGTATNVAWQYTRSRTTRDLYILLEQGPAFNEGPAASPFVPTGYQEALRFVAHDPFWRGLLQQQQWTLPQDIGDLVFDGAGAWFGGTWSGGGPSSPIFSVGDGRWLFDVSAIGESVNVVYWGTFQAKPIIIINGPANDPSVANTTFNKTINITADLLVGESMTIDTQAQTVTKSDGTNLLPFTTGDLATFGLWPAPQAPNRINEVFVAFSGADNNSAATMYWQNLYVGI